MTEQKHTEGPWCARQIGGDRLHWRVLAGVAPGELGFGGPDTIVIADFYGVHAEANAALIASAPALLDALRDAVAAAESDHGGCDLDSDEVCWNEESPTFEQHERIRGWREAIRLATEGA